MLQPHLPYPLYVSTHQTALAEQAGRLIEDFYSCYFQLQNCRRTVPVGWRVSRWKAEMQVGGRLPINHKEAGKEIETGNMNTKMFLVWVSLEAQAQSWLLNATAAACPPPHQTKPVKRKRQAAECQTQNKPGTFPF